MSDEAAESLIRELHKESGEDVTDSQIVGMMMYRADPKPCDRLISAYLGDPAKQQAQVDRTMAAMRDGFAKRDAN